MTYAQNEYLKTLNDKQREAATTVEGSLLILAGAGSGKTSTMTRRIAYLIDEKRVNPYNILAVTFTNKAAGEMRERVESLLGSKTDMWLMTFHAACLRMLRIDGELLGYTKSFVVYDPTDQKSVIKNALKELGADEKKFNPGMIMGRISKAKENRISPSEYKSTAENFIEETVGKIYETYELALRKNNAMDFDDLILNAVKLLEDEPDVLSKYQNRFKYIMVDEYQDTNNLQYRLISLLAKEHGNICVVGDDDQCIYQWRGANISNILNFEKEFKDTKVIKLEQNYRSTGHILSAAHSIIKNNSQRKDKKMWTAAEDGDKVYYERFEDDRVEADFICRNIRSLTDGDKCFRDFAILYRTNAQSRIFEEALTNRGIPYRVVGGLRYYDRMEIKDMISYMRLVANPKDDVAFERVINSPKRSIGKSTMDKLKNFAAFNNISLFELLDMDDILSALSSKAKENIIVFRETIKKYNEEMETLGAPAIYDGLLNDSGYLKSLEEQNTDEARGRIENLLEFRSAMSDMQSDDGEEEFQLIEFLEKIALLSDVDNHNSDEDAVSLMTMHSAKGLEFEFVFIPGMEDGLFPSWRSKDSVTQLEEERRLCYVAMTRAKKRLWMTGANRRVMYGKMDYTMESQFIHEIDKRFLNGISDSAGIGMYIGNSIDGRVASRGGAFRSVERAIKEVRKKDSKNISLNVGDSIKHGKFGIGKVVGIYGKIAEVDFEDAGLKKLAIAVAPIEKI